MLSYHTCPLATLGGKDTGGMNVYVRDLTRELGRQGIHVDVFTRSQDEHVPHVLHDLGYGNRVVHVRAGPEQPLPKQELAGYLPRFVEGVQAFAAEKGIHYDIIHNHYWMSGLAAEMLAETWKTPIVHMFHTLGEMKNRIAQSEAEKEGDYRLEGERRVLQRADRIIAATPPERAASCNGCTRPMRAKSRSSHPAWIPATSTRFRRTKPKNTWAFPKTTG